MNVERYQQIEALAEAALQVEPSRRSELLQRACGSDPGPVGARECVTPRL
jgi:hypothetical protein